MGYVTLPQDFIILSPMVPLSTRPVNVLIQLRLAHRFFFSYCSISVVSTNLLALLFVMKGTTGFGQAVAAGIARILHTLFILLYSIGMTPEEAKQQFDGIVERSTTELKSLLYEMNSSDTENSLIYGTSYYWTLMQTKRLLYWRTCLFQTRLFRFFTVYIKNSLLRRQPMQLICCLLQAITAAFWVKVCVPLFVQCRI